MPSHEQAQSKASKRSDDTVDVDVVVTEKDLNNSGDLDSDVDAILDEIDDLLEVNAEDFVKSFVQKGGQ